MATRRACSVPTCRTLTDTILRARRASVFGGKLAQLGQRLIAGAAKKMADDFFVKFAAAVNKPT